VCQQLMGSSPRAALRTGTRHCPSCRARRHESGDRQEALRVRSQVDMYRAHIVRNSSSKRQLSS